MNEQQTSSVEVLNHLHEAELHTLLPRLTDLTVAISRRQPHVASLLRAHPLTFLTFMFIGTGLALLGTAGFIWAWLTR